MESEPDPNMPGPAAPEPPESPAPGEPPAPGGSPGGPDVAAALAALTEQLRREHERAAHREKVIDRLHEENQRLRRDELQAALEPLRAALFRLHDQTRRAAGDWAAAPPDPAQAVRLLHALADDVADALARVGVERFTAEPGDPYDPARHRPAGVDPAPDPTADDTVTAVLSDGFERDGRVVRKAAVRVARLPPDGGAPARSSRLRDGDRSETMNTR
ncbi:nucleotide exchange factor GrpE [Actinomadura kijaniata]|uniref:nucleotide exchange factor GrpE n=1 Tax=Actinomadura kijaniata TaxID=46161 RepID=UPI003F1BED00